MRQLVFSSILSLSLAATTALADPRAGQSPKWPIAGTEVSDVAERALKSVVNISSTRVQRVKSEDEPGPEDPLFRFFGPMTPEGPRSREEHALGSGVIVGDDGTILTNYHVVEDSKRIQVTLPDRRTVEAEVKGSDPKSDLAVLKLRQDMGKLVPLPFGDSSRLRLGEVVLAVGDPFGVGETVTMGIVSAKGRADLGIVDYEDFIQTDAAINPGNSGGALVNLAGELVGINTAIVSRSGGYQGIGFAIPSSMAKPIMESLLREGKVPRGWLGVAIQELTPELRSALAIPNTPGVLVGDVSAGSPAARAGLEPRDVITKLDGETVESSAHFRNAIAMRRVGTEVTLEVLRSGATKTLHAKLGELPASPDEVEPSPTGGGLEEGLEVAPLSREARQQLEVPDHVKQGVVVTSVARESAAARAGIEPEDVITEVDRKPVESVRAFADQVRAAKGPVLLRVYRKGTSMFLVLKKQ